MFDRSAVARRRSARRSGPRLVRDSDAWMTMPTNTESSPPLGYLFRRAARNRRRVTSRARGSGPRREPLEQLGVAGADEEVVRGDAGLGRGVDELRTRRLHADDGDAVALADVRLAEREPLRLLRRAHLHDGEPVLDLDVVEQLAADQVRHTLARVGLGEDDVVRTDARQDAPVLRRDGLGPDLRRAHVDQVARDEHRRLARRADPDHGDAEVAPAEL